MVVSYRPMKTEDHTEIAAQKHDDALVPISPYGADHPFRKRVEQLLAQYERVHHKPLKLKPVIAEVIKAPEPLEGSANDILSGKGVAVRYYSEEPAATGTLADILRTFITPGLRRKIVRIGTDDIGPYVEVATPRQGKSREIMAETGEAFILPKKRGAKGIPFEVNKEYTPVTDVLSQHGLQSHDHSERVLFIVNGKVHPASFTTEELARHTETANPHPIPGDGQDSYHRTQVLAEAATVSSSRKL